MKTIVELFTRYKFILIVLLLSALAVVDLANYGLPPTHDGEYHIMRIWQFYRVLSDGNIFPLWAPDFNNGFGVPLFNYVYPLPNYIGSFFHWLGFSLIDSYKLTMVFGNLLGAIFMYLFISQRWGKVSGLVAATFYTYAPYHLLDIYVRGSVGEVVALGVFPGILWSYEKFMKESRYRYFVIAACLLGLLILSHNILAMIFFPVFLIIEFFVIMSKTEKVKRIQQLVAASLVGVGLASPFWLPAILERKYVQGLQTSNPIDHFPELYKLIYSSWGYGFSGDNGAGQMSFQIGIAGLFVVILAVILTFFVRKIRREVFFYFLILLLTIFFITPYSSWIWERLPLVNYVQFPWRLLSISTFLIALLSGLIVRRDIYKKNIFPILISTFLILLSIGFSLNYTKAPFYHKRADNHYLIRSNFTDGTNSPGDAFNTIWLDNLPKKAKNKIELVGKGQIEIIKMSSQRYIFSVDLEENSIVNINTAYFPFWESIIDSEYSKTQNSNGVISLDVNKGVHEIEVFVRDSYLRKISYFIFYLSILMLVLLYKFRIGIMNNKNNHENCN